MGKRVLRVTVVGCLLATVLGLIYGAHEHALDQVPWIWALADYLGFWWALGLLSGPCAWLVYRFPIQPGRKRNALYHLAAAAAASPLHTSSVYLALRLVSHVSTPPPGWTAEARTWGAFVLHAYLRGMIYYLLMVAIIHALTYYHQWEERAVAASQLEAQLAQAKLHLLKMQLHPHFLFNTLNSISALLHEDVEQADLMIERLGDFLRLTLERSAEQEVTLREELDFVNCYLSIEQIRLQDRLTSLVEVEPEAFDVRVPTLILQPLVENAIRHAIAPRAAPGRIEIRAWRQRSTLVLTVRDDGPGLPPSPRQNGKGMGLTITRARLERLYGAGHRFELANAPDGGLLVTIEIPCDSAQSLGAAG
jgi:two-component system, LytTR family, sensor kinase